MEATLEKPKVTNTSHVHSVNSSDRISNMPQDILQYILSFLETREVIRLSELSRRWRYLWTSMPYLTFSEVFDNQLIDKSKDFVWLALSLRDGSAIKRLCLSCEDDEGVIEKILFVATRRNVEELDLSINPIWSFELPSCLVHCKSLRVLKLHMHGCVFKLPTSKGISKLTTLHLVDVELVDSSFGPKLFSNCPVLENLYMERCLMHNLKVFEILANNLKSLTFVNTDGGLFKGELKVFAPNLISFNYIGPRLECYSFQNLSSLHNAFIYITSMLPYEKPDGILPKMVQGFHNVKVLRLSSLFMEYLSESERLPPRLYNLKSLKLCAISSRGQMNGILYLLKHSLKLETLVIDFEQWISSEVDWQPQEETLTCLIDHLKTVEITNFIGQGVGLEFVKFLLNNSKVLERMTIMYRNLKKKMKSFQEVLTFPKASPSVVILFPRFGRREPFWFEDEYDFYSDEDDFYSDEESVNEEE